MSFHTRCSASFSQRISEKIHLASGWRSGNRTILKYTGQLVALNTPCPWKTVFFKPRPNMQAFVRDLHRERRYPTLALQLSCPTWGAKGLLRHPGEFQSQEFTKTESKLGYAAPTSLVTCHSCLYQGIMLTFQQTITRHTKRKTQ